MQGLLILLHFMACPGLGCLRLTTVFLGRTIGGQYGCSAPEVGGFTEKVDYRLSMYWAASLTGYNCLIMGVHTVHNGLVPLWAVRWYYYSVYSDILTFRGCLAFLTSSQPSWSFQAKHCLPASD